MYDLNCLTGKTIKSAYASEGTFIIDFDDGTSIEVSSSTTGEWITNSDGEEVWGQVPAIDIYLKGVEYETES